MYPANTLPDALTQPISEISPKLLWANVCDFQSLASRLKKLHRRAVKIVRYIEHLKVKQKFLVGHMAAGRHIRHLELMSRRYAEYNDEERKFEGIYATLVEESGRLEVLSRLCVACRECAACPPRATLRRTRQWQIKLR